MNIISQTQMQITSPVQTTNYIVGSNLLANLHKLKVLQNKNYSAFLLLSDEIIFKIHGGMLIQSLQKLRNPIVTSIIKPREEQKSFAVIPKIIKPYFKHGFDRSACLVSFGGGVITDLGGFIASILLRGIASVYVPTTILGQIDAAIGGKTAVDYTLDNLMLKNMIGRIQQPQIVVSDVDTLKTLPEKEIGNGLGEMVKYWVGWGKPTLNQLLAIKTPERWLKDSFQVEELAKIISLCQRIKLDVITKDPFEQSGERQKLNLGHTIGHAIEAVAAGKLSHGEAVSIGMAAAARISVLMGFLSQSKYALIIKTIEVLELPISVSSLNCKHVIEAMKRDKKGGTFVVIKDIGKVETNIRVEERIILQVLSEIIK